MTAVARRDVSAIGTLETRHTLGMTPIVSTGLSHQSRTKRWKSRSRCALRHRRTLVRLGLTPVLEGSRGVGHALAHDGGPRVTRHSLARPHVRPTPA